jgi:hypothetical protein
VSETYTARWSVAYAGKLTITDGVGNEVDTFAIPAGRNRPSPGLFLGAVWTPYPGTEWEEVGLGQWSRAVFRENR